MLPFAFSFLIAVEARQYRKVHILLGRIDNFEKIWRA
jgi:uncharacterized membrane protein